MQTQTKPAKNVLRKNGLYIGDNGRCLCGACSGISAQTTGRDLSGAKVLLIDTKRYVGLSCENCGRK